MGKKLTNAASFDNICEEGDFFFFLVKRFIMHRKQSRHLNYFFHRLSFICRVTTAFDLDKNKVQENQISVLYSSVCITDWYLGAWL